jgi:hypothetical protein
LKSKRFVAVQDYKACRVCGQDYLEQDNYNWSCRSHRSEYSGEMWWCCGKLSKDALGCKFSKHLSKDEDEIDGLGQNEQAPLLQKCSCCKQTGHTAEECERDPNLLTRKRSSTQIEKDAERIIRIS